MKNLEQDAILLITSKIENIYHCVNVNHEIQSSHTPGLPLTKKSVPLVDQLRELCDEVLQKNTLVYPIEFIDTKLGSVYSQNLSKELPLYLVRTKNLEHFIPLKSDYRWQTIPAMLREMNKDKSRLPYLRAFEYLQGVHQLSIKVIAENERKTP